LHSMAKTAILWPATSANLEAVKHFGKCTPWVPCFWVGGPLDSQYAGAVGMDPRFGRLYHVNLRKERQMSEMKRDQSRALYDRARKVIPGGVTASARLNPMLKHALFMQRGQGPYVYDVDGNRYIDYCLSHGASLLGHGHPAVISAVQRALEMGVLCAYETEVQVSVAEQLLKLFPVMEMLRYSCTGTETTWHALRVARAYTGKLGVIKCEGHYHGVNDTV